MLQILYPLVNINCFTTFDLKLLHQTSEISIVKFDLSFKNMVLRTANYLWSSFLAEVCMRHNVGTCITLTKNMFRHKPFTILISDYSHPVPDEAGEKITRFLLWCFAASYSLVLMSYSNNMSSQREHINKNVIVCLEDVRNISTIVWDIF